MAVSDTVTLTLSLQQAEMLVAALDQQDGVYNMLITSNFPDTKEQVAAWKEERILYDGLKKQIQEAIANRT